VSRFDRIYRIHELLCNARHPVPMRVFTEELETSRNTITRDFEFLRDSLGAPPNYTPFWLVNTCLKTYNPA